MPADYKKIDSRGPEKQKEPIKDEACRCKQTSKMSVRQLFRVMISDLAFWNKKHV